MASSRDSITASRPTGLKLSSGLPLAAPSRAGIEAAKGLGVPVVCLSGPADDGARDDPPHPGRLRVPVGFVLKPPHPRQLRLSIAAALAKQMRERTGRRRIAALERDIAITRAVFDTQH